MAKWRLVQKTKEMDEIISASLGAHDSISKADTDMIPSHPHPIQNEQSSPEADRGSFVYDESPMRTPHAESDRGYTNASSRLQASYPDQSLHEQYMYNESAVHNTWRHHDPNHDFQGQYYGNGTYNYDHQHHLGSYNRMPATNDGYMYAEHNHDDYRYSEANGECKSLSINFQNHKISFPDFITLSLQICTITAQTFPTIPIEMSTTRHPLPDSIVDTGIKQMVESIITTSAKL